MEGRGQTEDSIVDVEELSAQEGDWLLDVVEVLLKNLIQEEDGLVEDWQLDCGFAREHQHRLGAPVTGFSLEKCKLDMTIQ